MIKQSGIAIVIGAIGAATSPSSLLAAPPLVPGNLLVLDSQDGNMHGEILQIDPQTGVQSVWLSGGYLQQPTDMVYDGKGNLIVSDFQSGYSSEIIRINLATGQQTQVSSGNWLVGASSVTIASNGDYIVTDQNSVDSPPSPNIVDVNPITGAQTPIVNAPAFSGSPIAQPERGILDLSGNLLITNSAYDDGTTGIFRINTGSGAVSAVSTGGYLASTDYGFSLLLDPADPNQLLVAGTDYTNPAQSAIIDVNLTTGVQSIFATGPLIQSPLALTTYGGNELLYSNYEHFVSENPVGYNITPSIVELDPTTGVQTTISSAGLLDTPQAILEIPEPSTTALACAALGALLLRRKRLIDALG